MTRLATLVLLCSLALLSLGATARHLPQGRAHWKGWYAWATRLSAVIARDLLRMEAQVEGACTLAFLETKHLFRLMAESPAIAQLVAEALGREVQAIYSGMGDLMLIRSAKGRLARVLLSLAAEDSVTHFHLAELANCSRETVTRVMVQLKRDGIISYAKGSIALLDRTSIEAMCE